MDRFEGKRFNSPNDLAIDSRRRVARVLVGKVIESEDLAKRVKPRRAVGQGQVVEIQVGDQPPVRAAT